METKFTPGPWSFYDDSNDGKTNRIEIVAIGKTIARIYHSVPEEDVPNARLIAAAPELFEALEQLLSECTAAGFDVKSGYNWADSLTDARAALAKATGEQA